MGAFRDKLNQKLKESGIIDGQIERPMLKTGIDWIDFLNASFNVDDSGKVSFETGIKQGMIATFVGPSGSGKSTVAEQSAINILKNDDDAVLYIFDIEKSNEHKRCCQISGIPKKEYDEEWKEKRIFIKKTLTTTEGLQTLIDMIYASKMEIGADLKMTIKDGRYSADALKRAKEIREATNSFPPTIIIIDSLAILAPANMTGQVNLVGARDGMANAAIAKANNALFKSSLEKCFEANIMLFIVNHIETLISTDMYGGDKRPLKFLKASETLPGGKDAIFLSDLTLRIDQGAKLTPDKEFGIKGFIQKITLVKSRNNAAGIDVDLIFDQFHGINNILTNYSLLKQYNQIGGAGRGFFLKALPDVKFTQAEVEELYKNNSKFAKIFDKEAHKIYEQIILEMSNTKGDSNLEDTENDEPDDEENDDSEEEGMTKEELIQEVKNCKGNKSLKRLCMEYEIEVDSDVFTGDVDEAKEVVIKYIKKNF